MPTFTKGSGGTPAIDATGAEPYARLLGITSSNANGNAAIPTLFPISQTGRERVQNIAAGGHVLTLADLNADLLVSTSAGTTSLTIPLMSTLHPGFVRDPAAPIEHYFYAQTRGLGIFAINGDTGVTIIWNDLDLQYLAQYHGRVRLTTVGDNIWAAS